MKEVKNKKIAIRTTSSLLHFSRGIYSEERIFLQEQNKEGRKEGGYDVR